MFRMMECPMGERGGGWNRYECSIASSVKIKVIRITEFEKYPDIVAKKSIHQIELIARNALSPKKKNMIKRYMAKHEILPTPRKEILQGRPCICRRSHEILTRSSRIKSKDMQCAHLVLPEGLGVCIAKQLPEIG